MAKGETAAERFVRLNGIAGTFREVDVPKDRKTSALDMAPAELAKAAEAAFAGIC